MRPGLSRLTHVQLQAPGQPATHQRMRYDALGNITEKCDVGEYTYTLCDLTPFTLGKFHRDDWLFTVLS